MKKLKALTLLFAIAPIAVTWVAIAILVNSGGN